MKKIFFLLAALVAGVTLTGFVVNKCLPYKNEMKTEWTYHTSVTAWYEATESQTLYIFYKQGNGVRKYVASATRDCSDYYRISLNELYRSNSCKDFRRNYRYVMYPGAPYARYYFNANLPYMENSNY